MVSLLSEVASGLRHLSIEYGLYVDLARQIKLSCRRLGTFVPLFENLTETDRIDFNELLKSIYKPSG
jgi:hypothetical protein